MNRTLPAGVLDDGVEFFNHPFNIEKVFAMTGGRVYPFDEMPQHLVQIVADSMAENPDRVEAIRKMGYYTEKTVMQKYISCVSGAFDGEADVVEGKFLLNEHWDCPQKHTCTGYGKACNSLRVDERHPLTSAEIKVLQLVGKALLDKEIAIILKISEHTVGEHLRNIRAKTGCYNKTELMLFCYQKNIL
jgi:DNA-binding CsgD family transcriptional regulator